MSEKKFTRQMVEELRKELNKAIAQFGEAHGLTLDVGNARFDETSIAYTLNVSFSKTENYDPDKANWDANCRVIGMKPEDFGKETTINGVPYVICGYNQRASKNRIWIRSAAGKVYVSDARSVKSGMKECCEDTSSGTIATVQKTPEQQWALYCRMWGFEASDFGRRFTLNGEVFTISGCNPQARKNVVLVTKARTGKEYSADVQTIREAFAEQLASKDA